MTDIDLSSVVAVYADGGCIGGNPSPLGITWAWCAVTEDDSRIIERCGYIKSENGRLLTNNHSEAIALTLALEAMPDGWSGIVCSDSEISLGRIFHNYKLKNMPRNVSDRWKWAVERLGILEPKLVKGHPTKETLERGYHITDLGAEVAVSIHNVWCDEACTAVKQDFYRDHGKFAAEINARKSLKMMKPSGGWGDDD